jgi:hypothetical protein
MCSQEPRGRQVNIGQSTVSFRQRCIIVPGNHALLLKGYVASGAVPRKKSKEKQNLYDHIYNPHHALHNVPSASPCPD